MHNSEIKNKDYDIWGQKYELLNPTHEMKVMITWLKCKSKKSKQWDLKVKIDLLFYKTDSIPQ